MIEIIYKEEKQEGKGNEELFSIPRNIRQIGLVNGNCRIYVEDYVYTFLKRLAEKSGESGENQGTLAVFTGESRWSEGSAYVFVRGALELEEAEAAKEHIDFTDKMWKNIQEDQEKYFPEQEIVGWFFAQPELPMEVSDLFTRTHLKYFAGGEKILMLMDPTEKDDAVFIYRNNFLTKQEGYYLFYEKNPQMQTYMMEKLQGAPTETEQEVPDEAVKAFRKIIHGGGNRQEAHSEESRKTERPSVFSYAATACLVIAILTVGGSFYRNYREMQALDERANAIFAETDSEKSAVETGSNGKNILTDSKESSGGAEIKDNEDDGEGQNSESETSGKENDSTQMQMEGTGQSSAKTKTDSEQTGQDTGAASGGQDSSSESEVSGDSVNGEDAETIYREESDVRKARRRQALLEQSAEETSSEGTPAGETSSDAASSEKNSSGGTSSGEASAEGTATGGTSFGDTFSGEAPAEGTSSGGTSSGEVSAEGTSSGETFSGEVSAEGTSSGETSFGDTFSGGSSAEETSAAGKVSGGGAHTTYVIRPGDTLYEISIKKYGSMDAISEICRLNDISQEEIIYPGQVIVLP